MPVPRTASAVLCTLLCIAASFGRAEDQPKSRLHEEPVTIRGTVTDAAGRPVSDAKVYLLSTTHEAFRRVAVATTDEDGDYEFRDVGLPFVRPEENTSGRDHGAFELLAVAKGHGFAWRPRKVCYLKRHNDEFLQDVDPPTFVFAEEPIEFDLRFSQPSSLTGRIVNEDGLPVAGVKLALRYCARIHEASIAKGTVSSSQIYELTAINQQFDVPVEVKVRETDQTGQFEFADLPQNCLFRVDLRHPDYAQADAWMATTADEVPLLGEKTLVHSEHCNLTFRRVYPARIRVVYDDTGEPAPGVFVFAGHDRTYDWKTSDEHGLVTLRLPEDDYKIQLLPARGTPYLVTDSSDTNPLSVTRSVDASPVEYRIQRGCELNVSVIDAETGEGIPEVDLWIDQRGNDLIVRSWGPPISYFDRPVSDEDGKLTALVKPGTQRIGAGNNKVPAGYRFDQTGQEIECEAGKTVSVTFRLKRSPKAR